MYVKRNIEARSRNVCCRGKAISITYSERMSATIVIRHTERMCRIIYCLSGCTVFFHITSQMARFSKKNVTERKICFDILCKFCLTHFKV
jgi:hypothetical protein